MALVNSKKIFSTFRLFCGIIFAIILIQLYHSQLSIRCKFNGFRLQTLWKVQNTRDAYTLTQRYRNMLQVETSTRPLVTSDPFITRQHNISKNEIQEGAGNLKQIVNGVCQKHTNIVFLKVHKTGSTTTWGIFARFAQANNLNMVLPKEEHGPRFNYLSSAKKRLRDTIMPLPDNSSYNILCNHVKYYNKTAFKEIMPSDTVYIGIMRNPLAVYVSGFHYFHYHKRAKELMHPRTDDMDVLHNFLKYDLKRRLPGELENRMSFDFGVPPSKASDLSYMRNYIQELDKDFKLVLITEMFDASLVLMKRYLCWDLTDILYLQANWGRWRRTTGEPRLTENDKSKIKQINQADVLMYEFFKARLKKQIDQEDDSFYSEVDHFKTISNILHRFCAKVQGKTDYYLFKESKWNSEFTVNKTFCDNLSTLELTTLRYIIKKTKLKYRNKI